MSLCSIPAPGITVPSGQVPVRFIDVAVYFSEEEWRHLEVWQKNLYMEVMQENLEIFLSLEDIFLHYDEITENSSTFSSNSIRRKFKGTYDQVPIHYKKYAHGVLEDLHHKCSQCHEVCASWSLLIDHKIDQHRPRLTPKDEETVSNPQNARYNEGRSPDTHDRFSLRDLIQAACTIQARDDEHTEKVQRDPTKCYKVRSNSESKTFPTRIHSSEMEKSLSTCRHCSKVFTDHSLLAEHEKSHKEDKTFTCPDCGKTFIRKSILKLHRRTHTGERPFACTECGKRFSQRFNLVIHQRIHTGEKPYRCPTCDKSFRYKPALVRHEKEAKCVKSVSKTQVVVENKTPVHPPSPTDIKPPIKTPQVPPRSSFHHSSSSFNSIHDTVESKRYLSKLRPLSSIRNINRDLHSITEPSMTPSSLHPRASSKRHTTSTSIMARELKMTSPSTLTYDQSSIKTLLAAPPSVCPPSGNEPPSTSSIYSISSRRHPTASASSISYSLNPNVPLALPQPMPTILPSNMSYSINTKPQLASSCDISLSLDTKPPSALTSSISHLSHTKPPLASTSSFSHSFDTKAPLAPTSTIRHSIHTKPPSDPTSSIRHSMDTKPPSAPTSSIRHSIDTKPLSAPTSSIRQSVDTKPPLAPTSSIRQSMDTKPPSAQTSSIRQSMDTKPPLAPTSSIRQSMDTKPPSAPTSSIRNSMDTKPLSAPTSSIRHSMDTKPPSAPTSSIRHSMDTKPPSAPTSSVSHSMDTEPPSASCSLPQSLYFKPPYTSYVPICSPSAKKLTIASSSSRSHAPSVKHLSPTSTSTIFQSCRNSPLPSPTSSQKLDLKNSSALSSARYHPSGLQRHSSSMISCSQASHASVNYDASGDKYSSVVNSTSHHSSVKEPPTKSSLPLLPNPHLPGTKPSSKSPTSITRLITSSAPSRASSHCSVDKPFTCSQCKKTFAHQSQLTEHQKSHNGSRNTCPECNKSFIRKSTLILHKRTHTGERPFACTECGRRFSQRFNLVVHERIHTGENPYVCTECHKSFRYRTGLLRHQSHGPCKKKPPTENSTSNPNLAQANPTLHRSLKSPPASQKSHRVSRSERPDLIRNLRREPPMERWQGVQSKTPLDGHLKSKQALFSILGNRASKRSTRSTSYKVNITMKPLETDKPFNGTDTLHSALRSSGEPSIVSHIPKVPVNIVSLNNPPVVNQVNESETKSVLVKWTEIENVDDKSSTFVLDNRTSQGHSSRTDKKMYKCDQCKKRFSQLNQYVEHQAVHSSGQHQCTMCSKVFGKASQLTVHQRTHTGEKPYSCGKCDKQFSQKFNLVVHQRIHTGEKPFTCTDCNKAFRYQTGLLKHQKYSLCS